MESRKEDTRRKIQMGGLVVKAGLDQESPAVQLGVMLHAAKALAGPDGEALRRRFRELGERAFSEGIDSEDS